MRVKKFCQRMHSVHCVRHVGESLLQSRAEKKGNERKKRMEKANINEMATTQYSIDRKVAYN